MKKAEAKTGNKVQSTTRAGKTVKSSKVNTVKPEPTIEEISRKAYEIYNQRISSGETGTQTDDWHKAVELLTKG